MEDLQAQEHLIEIMVHFHAEEEEVNASLLLMLPIILLANPSSSLPWLNEHENCQNTLIEQSTKFHGFPLLDSLVKLPDALCI